MSRQEFEQLVAEEFPTAVPEKFRDKISNVAFIVESEPSPELRAQEGLGPHETLLGHYRGIPHTSRGDWYGVGGTLPDAITLFQIPIEEEARELAVREQSLEEGKTWPSGPERSLPEPVRAAYVRRVIRETIWHEVAHHFGMDEAEVREREHERDTKA
jgi:predicted Zn-dependent protease with MMP-like domain